MGPIQLSRQGVLTKKDPLQEGYVDRYGGDLWGSFFYSVENSLQLL